MGGNETGVGHFDTEINSRVVTLKLNAIREAAAARDAAHDVVLFIVAEQQPSTIRAQVGGATAARS